MQHEHRSCYHKNIITSNNTGVGPGSKNNVTTLAGNKGNIYWDGAISGSGVE
jgi:hypothetical protein